MKHRLVLAVAGLTLALAPVLAGCGSSDGSGSSTHVMPDAMTGDTGSGDAPSETASMICGEEIREAVGHTLSLASAPQGQHTWSDQLYQCRYVLGAGELRLSVKDLDSAAPGTAYFDALRGRLPGPTTIDGMANFGFPAFETPRGDVVFIKDHKTLWVDASRLVPARLPGGMSRADVAYGVAAAVIGCWTE